MQKLNELALFAGAGGGILGGKLLGWRTVCAVEKDPAARDILVSRQNDGSIATFPIWDDIQTFDGKQWKGVVSVVSGGFPCQDISIAGKGEGITGKRSGLWGEMARVVSEIQPRFVFVENSPKLTIRGLGRVIGDLAAMGYDTRYGVLGGKSIGGCADGERIWILAYEADSVGWFAPRFQGGVIDQRRTSRREFERAIGACSSPEAHASRIGNLDGMARDMDRLRCTGNGQRPALAAMAFRILSEGII